MSDNSVNSDVPVWTIETTRDGNSVDGFVVEYTFDANPNDEIPGITLSVEGLDTPAEAFALLGAAAPLVRQSNVSIVTQSNNSKPIFDISEFVFADLTLDLSGDSAHLYGHKFLLINDEIDEFDVDSVFMIAEDQTINVLGEYGEVDETGLYLAEFVASLLTAPEDDLLIL